MDFSNFPFDQHECRVLMIFFQLDHELELVFLDNADIKWLIPNGEWEVLGIKHLPSSLFFENTFQSFYLVLTIKRRPEFVLVTVLLPTIFLSALSALVFVLPRSSGERASFSTTLLLALTLFLGTVTAGLPQNSDHFPVIVIYIFSMSCLSCLNVVASVVQLRVLDFWFDSSESGSGIPGNKVDVVETNEDKVPQTIHVMEQRKDEMFEAENGVMLIVWMPVLS